MSYKSLFRGFIVALVIMVVLLFTPLWEWSEFFCGWVVCVAFNAGAGRYNPHLNG